MRWTLPIAMRFDQVSPVVFLEKIALGFVDKLIEQAPPAEEFLRARQIRASSAVFANGAAIIAPHNSDGRSGFYLQRIKLLRRR